MLAKFHKVYINEDYRVKLSFSNIFTEQSMPLQEIKEATLSEENLGMRYTDPVPFYNRLEKHPKYKGFLIEIEDKKNNKTYTSKVFPSLHTEDQNSPYEFNNFMASSSFMVKEYESVNIIMNGIEVETFYIEADFECKLIDYKTNPINDDITVNNLLRLTDGKVVGLF